MIITPLINGGRREAVVRGRSAFGGSGDDENVLKEEFNLREIGGLRL